MSDGVAAKPTASAISQELRERDERDRNRASSPLRPAPDAVVIDSTGLTLDQVLTRIEDLVRPLLAREKAAK
jgi:cytidylate kinase